METIDVHLELVAALELRPKTRRNKKGLQFCCPRHEDKNPSAWLGEHRWGCHACDFEERLDTLCAELGIEPPKYGFTIEDYAQLKGFSLEKLKKWGVETGRTMEFDNDLVVIPYRDADGKLLRRKFRKATGTFWDPDQDKGHTYLYGLDMLAKASNMPVVLVEGESDCHAAWHHGRLAVGVPGANMWKPQWAPFFKGRTVYIWQEPGKAGEKFAETISHDLPDAKVIRANGCKDLADLHKEVGKNFGAELDRLTADAQPPDYTAPTEEGKSGADELLENHGEQFTLTDTGNAARLFALHGPHLRYIAPWDRWLVWDGSTWKRDDGAVGVREQAKDVGLAIRREAVDVLDKDLAEKLFKFGSRSLSASGISAMVNLARGIPGIPLNHELLDTNPYLLGVLNGVVDLHTGTLRPADPADLMTMQAPIHWDAKARAPRWERAMEEWFPDPDVRAYVQRVAGSVLVGAQRDHTFVIHYGSGGNGKGTFIRALEHVLGPYAVVLHLSLIEQRRFPEHDTVKADLFRARLAIASETERRIKLAEASVKNLTGGDRIRARRMREDPWSFDPSHSLWLQTNYLPEIAGRDGGIWRRICVIKWVATFAPAKEDLDATFRAEAPGILRWLVEGCLDWQCDGLAEPEDVIRETLAYRKSEDTFSRFAAECGLVFRQGLEIQASKLQDYLTTWAEEEGIDPPRREIGNWLRENGARKRQRRVTGPDGKEGRPKFYLGVGIDANDDDDETRQTDVLL